MLTRICFGERKIILEWLLDLKLGFGIVAWKEQGREMFTIILWALLCTAFVIAYILVITNYLNNKDNDYQEMKRYEIFKSKFDNE